MSLTINSAKTCLWILLFVLPVTASAQIYKWVDDNGKVHYTDKPPKDKQGMKNADIKVKSSSGSKGMLGTSTARKLKAISNDSPGDSRRVRLEKLIVDLDGYNGGNFVIGREYNGPTCKPSGGGFTWSKGRAEISGKNYRQSFSQVLSDNKFNIEDSAEQLFSEQKKVNAEISIAAVITKMEVNRCRHQAVVYNSAIKAKEKVASYFRVQWTVFDILERKVLAEITTEGSDSGLYDASVGDGPKISQNKSFGNAVINLLAKKEFVSLLKSTGAEPATRQSSLYRRLPIQLRYGNKERSFTTAIDSLKAATVTIRSVIGHGSGFIVSNDGYVLTNAHVVGDSGKAIVVLKDKELGARVIRVDDKRDIALLKIDSPADLQLVSISNAKAGSGESVYIIGTPLDEKFSHTVTRGIISAERLLEDGNAYYQTDAAINPGNSGGPAFNQYGEVIGIAVAGLFTRQGGSLNINFLIPIEEALKILGLK